MKRIFQIACFSILSILVTSCSFSLSADSYQNCLRGKIVFTLSTGKETGIFVGDLGTGKQKRLTDSSSVNIHPKWSPDGSSIVFVSYRDGNAEIYKMNADGDKVTRLTQNLLDDSEPAWSPDGKYIAFVQIINKKAQIFFMGSDGKNIKQLTKDNFNDFNPSWAPNGREIIFVSDRDAAKNFGHPALYILNLENGNQVLLGQETLGYSPEWSPDGNLVAYVSDIKSIRTNINRILLYDIQIGTSTLLVPGDIGSSQEQGYSYYNPIWSNDAKCVIFLQDISGENVDVMNFATRNFVPVSHFEDVAYLDWTMIR